MLAAAMQGLNKPLVVVAVPDPTPGSGEVIVRVGRCGICGSDLHMTEDPHFGKVAGDILGHEFSGEVVALGENVEGFSLGDRVSVLPLQSCGDCRFCMAGEPAWCSDFNLRMGGYAQYAVARTLQCIKLPETASLADGALVEPLAVALHGVLLAGVKPGDRVLIIGGGPIGLATAFWVRRFGASRVIVQDINAYHRERAAAMGATGFVVGLEDPVGSSIGALGGLADIVFECVGRPGLIAQAVRQVRNRGSIILLGLCTQPDSFNSFAMLSKEVRLITSTFFSRAEFEAALDALDSGRTDPRALVTDTVRLETVPDRFEELKRRTHQCKVLIDPHG